MKQEPCAPLKRFQVDKLEARVYTSRELAGQAAAHDVAEYMRKTLSTRALVRIAFAAAPSQNEFLANLAKEPDIDWNRVCAFHVDEYEGISSDAPQSFRRFLKERLFDLVHPGVVNYIQGDTADPAAECERYSQLLAENPLDIACIGIGENGHLAFNDPHVADFSDHAKVKLVTLDERCRLQQVHDGCFPSLDLVPRTALTMTIPAILSAEQIFCIVPGPRKREAVRSALRGPIATSCPASILRTHAGCTVYLDCASAPEC